MAEVKKPRARHEIPMEDTWDLSHLFATDEAWEAELATLEDDKNKLASYAGHLADSPETLYDYLYLIEHVNVKAENMGAYCMRKADEDTRIAKYQAMTGKLMGDYVQLCAAVSFETPEILAISDEKLDQFYRDCPKLERYRRYLTDLRRRKDHFLSEAEEKLLAAAGEMSQTPHNVYGNFANADLKFRDALDSNGQAHTVTMGNFVHHLESSDRVLRQNAYESMFGAYNDFRNTVAGLINAQNKQAKFFAEARNYADAREASLDENDVPVAVYDNLIEAVHKNLDKMHRYVRLRKKLLGVEELRFCDIHVPLVQDDGQKIPFAQAKEMVYEAMAPLGEEYRKILLEGFNNRWIDVYENEGKRSGGYCARCYLHPYILLNYMDNLDGLFTLAHEMGHALHSYLSCRTQNPIDANYAIFVAEVASTCNEALLMEYLLARTTDKKARAVLINYFLEQFKGTLFRQTMFAEFEYIIGNMVKEGATLTADILCQEYRRLNEQYFGPDIVVDDRIAIEWARIPHFYFNYYVFQYATGYSAAIALSRRILNGGEEEVKDYLNFLSGGCSASPIDLLKGAGVDMTTTEPVEQALRLFDELLDEIEALVD